MTNRPDTRNGDAGRANFRHLGELNFSQHPIRPHGPASTAVAAVSHLADRKLGPGPARERHWLMEDWEAANRRHHVLAVDPDADPAACEAAASDAQKALARVTLHKSEQASALFDMIRQAIIINPGILADRIDEVDRERNRKLRKRFVAHGANAVGCDPANFALPGLAVLAAAVGNATRGDV